MQNTLSAVQNNFTLSCEKYALTLSKHSNFDEPFSEMNQRITVKYLQKETAKTKTTTNQIFFGFSNAKNYKTANTCKN